MTDKKWKVFGTGYTMKGAYRTWDTYAKERPDFVYKVKKGKRGVWSLLFAKR